VELFEQIRREYEHGGGTIRGIAKKLGIHRRMVRKAVLSAVPVERKTPVRERPKLEPAMAFIDALLEADRKAPRKQRHTAHRIWCRIRAEMPEVKAAESTIRRHVRERKVKLGLTRRETFIPQSYSWGAEAQVDWYEAYVEICGERQKHICFACGVWPEEEPSIARFRTPVSRLFSKPTSWRSPISAEYSRRFATITSRVR
jgi:hypothetical protein